MSSTLTYRPGAHGVHDAPASAEHAFDEHAAPRDRGLFLVLEGGDGTGKSTQARLLADRIRHETGAETLLTREPGGTPIGEALRGLVLEHGHGDIDAHTEALVYAASRAAHAHQLIRPALERGAVVVCDRYLDSSAAYQGAGRGLGEDSVRALSRWATEDLAADLTLVLAVDPQTARTRRAARGLAADRLESEPEAFHARVDASFRRLAAESTGARADVVAVDGQGSTDEVAERIWQRVQPLLDALRAGEPA